MQTTFSIIDNFFDYRPTDTKTENRPMEPVTASMFQKCAIAQSRYFGAVYGGEYLKPRLKAIKALVNTHEDHPKVRPIEFIGDVWGRANHDFTDYWIERIRRIVRIAPPGSKRDKIARSAWRPRAGGTPLWQFPDTFAIESHTGFWQSIIIPEMDRKMESQMIANALGKTTTEGIGEKTKHTRAGNEKPKAAHTAGKRLRPNEQDADRKNSPRSKHTG